MAIFPLGGSCPPSCFGVKRRRRADTTTNDDDNDPHLATRIGIGITIQCPDLVSHLELRACEYGIGLVSRRVDRASVTRLHDQQGWDRHHTSPSWGVGCADCDERKEFPDGGGGRDGNDRGRRTEFARAA